MNLRTRIAENVRAELVPYPGRLEGSLQDAVGMVTALAITQVLRIPGASLALPFVLLLERESPGLALRNFLRVYAGAVVACLVTLLWIQVTDANEVARYLGVLLVVFTAGFGIVGSRFPLFFTIFGFYSFVDLAAWDTLRPADVVVSGILYNLASLGVTLGTAWVVNYLFSAREPRQQLSAELDERLILLARFYNELANQETEASPAIRQRITVLAHEGDLRLRQLYEQLRSNNRNLAPGIRFRLQLIVRLLRRATELSRASKRDTASLRLAANLAASLVNKSEAPDATQDVRATRQLQDSIAELREYAEVERALPATMPQGATNKELRIFSDDAFRSPAATLYALKLTLCAVLCYSLYSAVAWPGILTSVVTVLFTGLSSAGAMKEKQLYRLTGAAIGGTLAIAVEAFLFPNMDSITSLLLLAGGVCLFSAWISRSARIGYVGVQIAFAFFLTVLTGFGAASELAPARDRLFGIGLGIAVMYVVFGQIWPARASNGLQQILQRMRERIIDLEKQAHNDPGFLAIRDEMSSDLGQVQTLLSAVRFDLGSGHLRELAKARRLRRQIEAAATSVYKNLRERRT